MAMGRRRAATAALITAAVLSGCDSTPPEDDATSPGPTTTTTTTTSRTLAAPAVRDPLDASDFEAEPCTSLTAAQLTELSLGGAHDGNAGNADQAEDNCTYFDLDPATDLIVYVNYYPEVDDGLSGRYLEHQGRQWDVWAPTEIDGYPAVAFRVKADRTACDLDIGLSDTSYVNVRLFYFAWKGYGGSDTCAQVRTVGEAVLATIKAAS
jgi:hypothetical protein